MIAIRNLKHTFHPGFHQGLHPDSSLTYPDWKVADEEHGLILGPSGCGKTTLLHLLSGLRKPTEGEVIINGTSLQRLSPAALDKFRGRHIGLVFQQPHLLGSLTVRENLKLAAYLAGQEENASRIDGLLKELGLSDLGHRKVHEISQGQAQRVAIARAVINRPAVICGDEPTASLDDESCDRVINLLHDQAKACRATLIIATHDHRVKSRFGNQLTL